VQGGHGQPDVLYHQALQHYSSSSAAHSAHDGRYWSPFQDQQSKTKPILQELHAGAILNDEQKKSSINSIRSRALNCTAK